VPDVEEVLDILLAQRRDDRTAGGPLSEDAFLDEHPQRLADGEARDVELGGKVSLDEPGPRSIVALEDPRPQGVADHLSQRSITLRFFGWLCHVGLPLRFRLRNAQRMLFRSHSTTVGLAALRFRSLEGRRPAADHTGSRRL
jgi:hypothetical protein